MAAEKLSAKEAAIQLGTDARTLRKFIRSDHCDIEPVGQGSRYEFSKGDLNRLRKQYTSWSNGKTSGATTSKKTKKAPPQIEEPDIEEVVLDDDDDLDSLDDPTIEDLEIALEDDDVEDLFPDEDEPDLDDDGDVVELDID